MRRTTREKSYGNAKRPFHLNYKSEIHFPLQTSERSSQKHSTDKWKEIMAWITATLTGESQRSWLSRINTPLKDERGKPEDQTWIQWTGEVSGILVKAHGHYEEGCWFESFKDWAVNNQHYALEHQTPRGSWISVLWYIC